jgi:hypothetical protein
MSGWFASVAQAGVIGDAPRITTIVGNVFTFLLSLAGILAIIALVVASLRFLFSGGNVERATSAKRSFFLIILGLIILFGALVIVRQISSWLG